MRKESKNIQLGNAELERKWVKCGNVQIYCLVPTNKGECF
jgi:hypothetical protein